MQLTACSRTRTPWRFTTADTGRRLLLRDGFLDGIDLEQLVRAMALAAWGVVHILRQICRAPRAQSRDHPSRHRRPTSFSRCGAVSPTWRKSSTPGLAASRSQPRGSDDDDGRRAVLAGTPCTRTGGDCRLIASRRGATCIRLARPAITSPRGSSSSRWTAIELCVHHLHTTPITSVRLGREIDPGPGAVDAMPREDTGRGPPALRLGSAGATSRLTTDHTTSVVVENGEGLRGAAPAGGDAEA